jgi:hypothetical protein
VAVELDPAGQQFGELLVEQVTKSLQRRDFRECLAGDSGRFAATFRYEF